MNWRPIKTAPRDRQILLSYIGGDGETAFTGQGIWVDVPHNNYMNQLRAVGKPVPQAPFEGHWEIGYVAILEHGGAWSGRTFEPRSWKCEPTHWMPLPKPSNRTV